MYSEKLRRTVIHIVKLLVERKYDDLASLSEGKRLTAMNLRRAIDDYGRHLVMPPMASFEQLNVIKIQDSVPAQWYVGVDLWTTEEGRSDLALELTLTDSPGDLCLVELDDLHVL